MLFLLLPCARRRGRLLARWQLRRLGLHLGLGRPSLCVRLCLALRTVIELALAGTWVHNKLPSDIRQQDQWGIKQPSSADREHRCAAIITDSVR